MQILYSYLRYTDRLLGLFFLLLTVISEFHEKPIIYKKKKNAWKNFCEVHHFLGCTSSFLRHFLSLFLSTSIIRQKKNAPECKVSAQCIISQNFLEICRAFLSIPQRLSGLHKNYLTMSQSVQVESRILGNFFCPSFWKILRCLTRRSCKLFCFFFVVFSLLKS